MSTGLDYDIVGHNMKAVKDRLVSMFVYALKQNRKPDPAFLWGPPGIGKTFTVYDVAKEVSQILKTEVEMKSLMLSTLDPCDIAGVPHRHGDHPFTQYLPLNWAWLASKEYEESMRKEDPNFVAPPMIIFFDDFPVAHQQTQAACFKVVHEGMAGDLTFRDNVFQIGAGNRPEDNAAAQEMPTAMASRFRHFYCNLRAQDWIEWATKRGGINPYVVGFVRHHRDALHQFDPNSPEKAFPCPRTWEMLSNALFENESEVKEVVKNKKKGASTDMFKVTAGVIGTGMAHQFHAYLDQTRFAVPVEEVLKNPKGCKVPDMNELDALHATVASLEHHIRQNVQDWKPVTTYLNRKEMMDELAIILAAAVTDAIIEKADDDVRIEAFSDEQYEEMNDKYGKYITAGY